MGQTTLTPVQQPGKPPRVSRRHRRLYLTLATVVIATAGGAVWGVRLYRALQPAPYRPGEALEDITSKLAPRAAPAPAHPLPVRDGLRNPGQALPAGAPAPRFVDVTAEAGLSGFRSFLGNRSSQLPEDMGSGLAWGDFDNDGNDDLFLVSAGGPLTAPASARAPSLLYRNLGNGRFQKVDSFPDTRIRGMGAAWGDYNNDGWLDLVVTGYDTLLLFRNDRGRLVRDRRFPDLKGFWTGASWGDYDRDGYLDLYICGYVRYQPNTAARASSQQFGLEVPFTLNPSSYEPERNLLFHNNGDGTFTEMAAKLGVDDVKGRSLSALWHDFDGDGWPDLYVANDVSENKLYLNRHGKFVDAGSEAWVQEYRGSMGLAAGDFDRDGDDDLFISHWIAQQFALYQNLKEEEHFAAHGGTPGELHFTDVAEMRGVGQPSLQSIGWGTAFFDFDSDGWPDLAVAAGSTFETNQAPRRLRPMPSFLFWNRKGKQFYDLAAWNQSLAAPHTSRGLAVADYDNDGALDLAIVDHGEGVRLLHNQVPQGHWLELRLRNRVPGTGLGFGDGATVVVRAGGAVLRRTVSSASYLSQDSRRVHVGLGSAARADVVEVQWPDGRTDRYPNLEARAVYEIREGEAAPRSAGAAPAAGQFWSIQHGAMDAMKRDNDLPRAIQLFRDALVLDPTHEDSRYYLANCLAAEGDDLGALAELDRLLARNPGSHRAWQRKGALLAITGAYPAANAAVQRALELNQEETGSLELLGEIALAQKDLGQAERYLEWTARANPRAVHARFLRAYVLWRRGKEADARRLLREARANLGPEWRPRGTVAEGDVRRQMFQEASFLLPYCERWDGTDRPAVVFRELDTFLRRNP